MAGFRAKITHQFRGRLRQPDIDLSAIYGGGGGCSAEVTASDVNPRTTYRADGAVLISVSRLLP